MCSRIIFCLSFVERPGFSSCDTSSNSKMLNENYVVNSLDSLGSPVFSSACIKSTVGNSLQKAPDALPNSFSCFVGSKPEETNFMHFEKKDSNFSGNVTFRTIEEAKDFTN
jgi:hypothetical protein